MGSHSSKAGKGDVIAQEAAAGDASPSKSNGQENGHVKINGDVSPKADGEASSLNGNGSAEPVQQEATAEAGGGDAIEPAPVAEGGEAQSEGAPGAAASKETPKKKKKFSFKKPFKLSGISFRKAKKEAGDTSAASSPSEEPVKAEAKGEENPACATEESEQAGMTKEETPEGKPAAPLGAAATAPEEGQQEAAVKREEGDEGRVEEEQQQQQQAPASGSQEDAKPEEASKATEAEPSPTPGAAEQKEE
ncbi:MARCKS-related protein isoform X2 [Varanus komodoensis]|nr:MARCKS-related protein isoform X2 [Varanus komodoensis]